MKIVRIATDVTPAFCRRLQERSNAGYQPSPHEVALVHSAWLQLQEKLGHSTGGRDYYPHIDFWQKVRDIEFGVDSGSPPNVSR